MHGDRTTASASSAGDKDGERRGGGFQPAQHRGSTSGPDCRPSDDNGGRRARGVVLLQQGDGTTASAWSARDKDGERRGDVFQPAQHRGSTSGSAWRPSDDNGGRRARDIQLAQHSSGSAWRGSDGVGDATAGGRPPPRQDVSDRPGSSRGGTADSATVVRFIEMGFPAEKARLALEHAGGGQHEEEAVLEWLVAHQETDLDALSTDIEGFSSSSSEGVDLADFDDDEGLGAELTEKDKKFLYLVEMGFAEDEISSAMNTCGEHEPVGVLADAIYAAQIARRGEGYDKNIADVELSTDEAIETSGSVKRKYVAGPSADKGRPHNKQLGQVDMAFGSGPIYNRKIPDIAKGPPYFYFESMAYALQGVGDESGFLHDIQPEFIDTKDFCAVTQTRRCIHNLPTLGRFHITPAQPRTIHEVFPQTMMWWPPWDNRTQLNCIRTKTAPAAVFKNVRFALTNHLNEFGRRRILDECMEWNLIWVGPKTVAALEPGEVELVLGLPRDHTRGFSMTDRYRALGNSVQVDTLAYHLSVLGERFPSGIRVLSLFSGIGGAEIALNRLGIQLNVVVSAELCKMNQNIMRSWWDQSKQTGELIQVDDIQKLKGDYLETLVRRFGGFDLVIGGSLEQPGQFCRCSHILAQVKQIMRRM